MKLNVLVCAVVMLGMASSPAWALFCADEGPKAPDIVVVQGNGERVMRPDTEAQQELDLRRLRDAGVDARSVERWNGCLRAFMTGPDGRQSMEFYDPATLQRLQ